WTNFLCGGNIRGGQVVGATDRIGSRPHDFPVEPPQILASIYHGMGINLDTTMMPGPGERPIPLIDAEPIGSCSRDSRYPSLKRKRRVFAYASGSDPTCMGLMC